MFERLGSWTYRFRYPIVVAWVVAAIACARFAPSLAGSGSTDQASFLPPSVPSVQARDALERAFPGSTSASSATITLERAGGLTAGDLAYRDAFATWTASADAPAELRGAVKSTETADSRPELASMLRSGDGRFEMLIVNLDVETAGDASAVVTRQLRDQLASTAPAGLEAHVTGAAAISSDYLAAVKAGTESSTKVTIILVLIVLLLIYRAPLAALVPLLTIGSAFAVSRGVLGFLASLGWQVSSLLDTFLVVMVFGVGTDYAIFLISRYREEVSGGGDWHDAARITVKRIGSVISASAATVMVGMAAMAFGDFKMVSSTGPAIAVAIFVTLIAGLTLAPALLSVFGHYLFWPLHTRAKPEGEPGGFFARLASAVSRHPGVVTIGLLAALLLPAAFVPQVRTNFDVLTELPADADSRVGYEAISRNLGAGKLTQSTGLVAAGGGVDMLAPATLAKLRDQVLVLQGTPGVGSVTSLVTPDGDGVVPDGFRPSVQLGKIGDDMAGDGGTGQDTDSKSLLDPKVSDGLDSALDYVNGLGVAFPDVAGASAMRAVTGGIEHAQDIVTRVRDHAVLSTQLRTLATSITAPSAAAGSGGDTSSSLMADYVAELSKAYPEVRTLDAFKRASTAATSLAKEASIGAALDLAAAFNDLAVHFDGRPDATLSPRSLANTPSALELKHEAETVFGDLPDQFAALGTVFADRSDDLYVPTTLTGDDGKKIRDAIDAFVSKDRTASRFYVTGSNDPYSGDAFSTVRTAQRVLAAGAPAFGPSASAYLGGPTAQFADVQDTMARDFGQVGVITVLGILIVLVVLLRAVVAPLYLVATVLVSYGSAVGLSAWFFQDVLHQPGISFYLPLMVFVLLVALGSDYNIFLMSRVREESETRTTRDGIRIASGHTGAVITSAGLILAGTFGSMATAPLIVLFQVGVAVAVGVLIDTFVVRSILVPAITTLFGDRAWWPSGAAIARGLAGVPRVAVGEGALAGSASAAGAGFLGGSGSAAGSGFLGGSGSLGGAVGARASRRRLAIGLGMALLVPVAVAGLLTWSLGAQAGNLRSVRAAVVDLDQGGSVPAAGGTTERLTLGADLSRALSSSTDGGFTWVTATAAEASAGLADSTYAAVLTIPADFSRSVAAIRGDTTGNAPRAMLRLLTDDGSGYALGTVAREVTAAIEASTSRGVTASYVDGILVSVGTAHDALASAATDAGSVSASTSELADSAAGTGTVAGQLTAGLKELADGASDAVGGTTSLVDGTRRLADGSAKLASGATKLASGAQQSASGANKLADGATTLSDGLSALETQAKDLPAQAGALSDGADGVAGGADGVSSGATGLATGLHTLRTGTTGLGDQGQALHAGATSLRTGATQLSAGADQAAAGAADLATGASQLSNGVSDYTGKVADLAANCVAMGGTPALCAALDGLANGGAPLAASATDLAAGAHALKSATDQVASGAGDVKAGATQLAAGTGDLAAALPDLETGIATSAAGAADLATGAAQLKDGADQLAVGIRRLAAGMPLLAGGIAKLSDGAAGVASGATSLASGLDTLAAGAGSLASGARESASGARTLANGTSKAASGIDRLTGAVSTVVDAGALVEAEANGLADDSVALSDQADALAKRLADAADTTSTYPAESRSRLGGLAADPVGVDTSRVNAVGGPAGGLAPFLMAIAAWLGVLAAFLVLPGSRAGDDRRWWRAVLIAFGASASVAVAGALVMVLGVRILVGVEVAGLPALIGFAVLAAVAFTAIVGALVALFGSRGWLLGLLLLVIGIAASGMPIGSAAAPGPLALVRPLVPLTYAIDAFHGAVAGSGSASAIDAIVLAGWLVAGLLVTLAVAAGAGRRDVGGEELAATP
jgi:putative drug exporter of the RND superfamily